MSTLYVDTITEKTAGNGVQIAGHVVQVQSFTIPNTQVTNTTSSFVTLTSTTFTPLYSNSKVLVQVLVETAWGGGSNQDNDKEYRLLRTVNSTDTELQRFTARVYDYGASGIYVWGPMGFTYLDAPATTNAITYAMQGKQDAGSGSAINGESSNAGQIVFMEIAQ
jgi:hypothetical protein